MKSKRPATTTTTTTARVLKEPLRTRRFSSGIARAAARGLVGALAVFGVTAFSAHAVSAQAADNEAPTANIGNITTAGAESTSCQGGTEFREYNVRVDATDNVGVTSILVGVEGIPDTFTKVNVNGNDLSEWVTISVPGINSFTSLNFVATVTDAADNSTTAENLVTKANSIDEFFATINCGDTTTTTTTTTPTTSTTSTTSTSPSAQPAATEDTQAPTANIGNIGTSGAESNSCQGSTEFRDYQVRVDATDNVGVTSILVGVEGIPDSFTKVNVKGNDLSKWVTISVPGINSFTSLNFVATVTDAADNSTTAENLVTKANSIDEFFATINCDGTSDTPAATPDDNQAPAATIGNITTSATESSSCQGSTEFREYNVRVDTTDNVGVTSILVGVEGIPDTFTKVSVKGNDLSEWVTISVPGINSLTSLNFVATVTDAADNSTTAEKLVTKANSVDEFFATINCKDESTTTTTEGGTASLLPTTGGGFTTTLLIIVSIALVSVGAGFVVKASRH